MPQNPNDPMIMVGFPSEGGTKQVPIPKSILDTGDMKQVYAYAEKQLNQPAQHPQGNVAQQLLEGLRNYVAGPHPMFDAAAQQAAKVAAKIQGIPSIPQAQAATGPFLRQMVGATAEAAAHPIQHADVTLPAATVAALAPLTAGEDLPVGLQALGAFLRLAGAGTAGYAGGNIAGKNPVDSAANAMLGQGVAELPGVTGQLFQGLGKAGAYKNLTTTPAIRGSIMRQNPEILTNQSADKALADMFLKSPGLAFKNEDAIVGELNDQFQNAVNRRNAAVTAADAAGGKYSPRAATQSPEIAKIYGAANTTPGQTGEAGVTAARDTFVTPPRTPGAQPKIDPATGKPSFDPRTGEPIYDPADIRRYWDDKVGTFTSPPPAGQPGLVPAAGAPQQPPAQTFTGRLLPPDQRFLDRPYSEGQTSLEGLYKDLDRYYDAKAAAKAQGTSLSNATEDAAATNSAIASNVNKQLREPDVSFLPPQQQIALKAAAAERNAATDTMANIYPLKEAVVKGTNADDAFNLRQRLSLGEGFLPKVTQYLYHSPLSPSLGKARTLFEVGQNAQSPLLPAIGRLSYLLAKGEPKDEPDQ